MRQIRTAGNLPPPIRKIGLLSDGMAAAMRKMRDHMAGVDTNVANMLAMAPEIWECDSVYELGTAAHLDDCEIGVVRDRENGRYYLTAMSADPDRARAKVDDSPLGVDLVADTGPKASLILYFTPISRGQFHQWGDEDRKRRIQRIKDAAPPVEE